MSAKKKTGSTAFRCTKCGYSQPRWLGRCPECGEWNTLEEIIVQDAGFAAASSLGGTGGSGLRGGSGVVPKAIPLSAVDAQDGARLGTGIPELDRGRAGNRQVHPPFAGRSLRSDEGPHPLRDR